jgi:hypothetical protein
MCGCTCEQRKVQKKTSLWGRCSTAFIIVGSMLVVRSLLVQLIEGDHGGGTVWYGNVEIIGSEKTESDSNTR